MDENTGGEVDIEVMAVTEGLIEKKKGHLAEIEDMSEGTEEKKSKKEQELDAEGKEQQRSVMGQKEPKTEEKKNMCDEEKVEKLTSGTENEEESTKINKAKLFDEIRNFRDLFSRKAFLIALLFGLLPSGWDTFSDFAFASDDHNSTIQSINATKSFVLFTSFQNGTTRMTHANWIERNMSVADSYNFTVGANETQKWQRENILILSQGNIKAITCFIITIPSLMTVVRYILNLECCKTSPRLRITWNISKVFLLISK